jgi:hypothetical protein
VECGDNYPGLIPQVSLFHDELVLFDINAVRFRAVQQVKRVDLHVDKFREIERIVFLLILLMPEHDDAVLHLLAAHDRVHTVHSYDPGLSNFLIRVTWISTVKGLSGSGSVLSYRSPAAGWIYHD